MSKPNLPSNELKAVVRQTALAFRLGRHGEGHRGMERTVGCLQHGISGARTAELIPLLEAMLSAQLSADFLFLADLLEYGLLPTLPLD